ncbi:hypothetical protein [Streptomyces cucumeris]|uniref:hypothetical protein n=1 Tax=Streptomyces cucumeris TaxID=2962890 RepID=UPI003D74457E
MPDRPPPGRTRGIRPPCPGRGRFSAPVLDLKDRLLPSTDAEVSVERLRGDLRDPDRLADLLLPRTAGRRWVILAEGLLTY